MQQPNAKARDFYQRALTAWERRNLDYTILMLQHALESDPQHTEARQLLHTAIFKRHEQAPGNEKILTVKLLGKYMSAKQKANKNPHAALVLLEEILADAPTVSKYNTLFAEVAQKAKLPEAGIIALQQYLKTKEEDVDAWYALGSLYSLSKQPREARECYERIVMLRPNDQKAIKALKDAAARDTISHGGWDSAGSYRDVIKDQEQAEILEQQNKSKRSESDIGSLIEETKAALEAEPNNISLQQKLAGLCVEQEDYDQALDALEQALQLSGGQDPQIERSIHDVKVIIYDYNINALNSMGKMDEVNKMREEKENFLFEDAAEQVSRYPNDLRLKFEYGKLLFQRNQWNEAIQQFQQAQRNPQHRIASLQMLGLSFKAKGQLDIALEQLNQALSEQVVMDEAKKHTLYTLGEIYVELKRGEEAKDAFKSIYTVDIGYRDVAQRIEQNYSNDA